MRIILVEPTISIGGHGYKNLIIFNKDLPDYGVDFQFVTEKNIKSSFSKCKPFLTPFTILKNFSLDKYVNCRVQEYKSLIKETNGNIYIFLTTLDEDFSAWLKILEDREIVKEIIKKDKVLIIHSSNSLYLDIYNLKKSKNFELLKHNIFFSFFSIFQSEMARKISNFSLNFFPFFMPHFKPKQNNRYKRQYVSFLGALRTEKGPDFIIETTKKMKNIDFQIQTYPPKESNFIAIMKLKSRSNVKVLDYILEEKDYEKALSKTLIGILPYDPFEYAVRTSGILEEYMFSGIPVVVPKETWMEYFLMVNNGSGLSFNGFSYDEFEEKIESILKNYSHYYKKAQDVKEEVYNKRNLKAFMNVVNYIYKNRSVDFLSRNASIVNSDFEKIIKKGYCFYYTRVGEKFINRGFTKDARDILEKAFTYSTKYWKTHYLYNKIAGNSKNTIILFDLLKNENIETKMNKINILKRLNISALEDKSLRKIKNFYFNDDYTYFFSLNEIPLFKNIINFKENVKEFLTLKMRYNRNFWYLIALLLKNIGELKKAKRLFSVIHKNEYELKPYDEETESILISTITFLIELSSSQKKKDLLHKQLINLITNKKNKTPLDVYRIASFHKRNHDLALAVRYYKKIIYSKSGEKLQAGAYFHLGEIELWSGNKKNAKKYFKKCLKLNPSHQKAKQYLDDLTRE